MAHAAFTWSIKTPVISIVDVGNHSLNKTVTNDIEWVIERIDKELKSKNDDIKFYRVIYQDSDGNWDGISVKNGKFDNFIPLQTTLHAKAHSAILNETY